MMGSRIRNVDPLYTQPETIHAEFTYNLWVSALWNQIMGDQTLADVVARIFTGVTSALQTVKKGLSKAWDGIKSAGQYIGSGIFKVLNAGIQGMMQSALDFIFSVISGLDPLVSYTIGSSRRVTRGNLERSFSITSSENGISLLLDGRTRISIDLFMKMDFETLGLKKIDQDTTTFLVAQLIAHIVAMATLGRISPVTPQNYATATGIALAAKILAMIIELTMVSSLADDSDKLLQLNRMANFHMTFGLELLANLVAKMMLIHGKGFKFNAKTTPLGMFSRYGRILATVAEKMYEASPLVGLIAFIQGFYLSTLPNTAIGDVVNMNRLFKGLVIEPVETISQFNITTFYTTMIAWIFPMVFVMLGEVAFGDVAAYTGVSSPSQKRGSYNTVAYSPIIALIALLHFGLGMYYSILYYDLRERL